MRYIRLKKGRLLKRCAALALAGLTAAGLSFASLAQEKAADVYSRLVNTQQGVSQDSGSGTKYSSYRSGNQDKAADGKKDAQRVSRPEDAYTGPGAGDGINVIQDNSAAGPTVKEVSLSENYHEDYAVYEENMGDVFFIYTNVANGGITDQPVKLDIPANLNFTAQKDGTDMAYVSGQPISGRGSYIFHFEGTADGALAFSKQTIYKASFRFRIQDKPPETAAAEGSKLPRETDMWGEAAAANAQAAGALPGAGQQAVSESQPAPLESQPASSGTQPETGADQESTAGAAAQSPVGQVMGEDGTIDEETLNKTLDQMVNGDGKEQAGKALTPSGITTTFDQSTGFYQNELASDAAFYTNVPNGTVTNQPVSLRGSDGITFTVYKDGQEFSWDGSSNFEEDGSYTVIPRQDTTAYLSSYSGGNTPVFRFRIVTHPVRDLGIVNAPEGMHFTEITLDGEPVPVPAGKNSGFFFLKKDGTYEITMAGDHDTSTVQLTRDTVQPRFYVKIQPNQAVVSYLSSDAASCVLYKNGKVVSNKGMVSQVEGKGSYELQVYDAAGNMSSYSFSVSYRPNTGAVVGMVLVAAVVALLAVYFFRVRKQTDVR